MSAFKTIKEPKSLQGKKKRLVGFMMHNLLYPNDIVSLRRLKRDVEAEFEIGAFQEFLNNDLTIEEVHALLLKEIPDLLAVYAYPEETKADLISNSFLKKCKRDATKAKNRYKF